MLYKVAWLKVLSMWMKTYTFAQKGQAVTKLTDLTTFLLKYRHSLSVTIQMKAIEAVFQTGFKGMVSRTSFEGSIDVGLPTPS